MSQPSNECIIQTEGLLAQLRGETTRTLEESVALFGDSLPLGLRLAEDSLS